MPDCLPPIIDLTPGVKPPAPTLSVSACPHPFEQQRVDYVVPAGLTIAEIIEVIQPDPLLRTHGYVFLGEHLVPRDLWQQVRPKPDTRLTIRILVGSGQTIMRIVGAVLIVAGAIVSIFPGGFAFGGPMMIAGASLIAQSFLMPPAPKVAKNQEDEPSYAITGQRNEARLWEKVPFLLGRFKLTPPYGALPYREIVGGAVYWRVLFAFSHGPIAIESMWIGETALGNFQDVQYQFRRGYWSMPDKGAWNAASGAFPTSPAFGDTWTCTIGGSVAGVSYVAGETITFNALVPASDPNAWDRDQGKPFSLYPHDVYEEPLSVGVKYGTPQVRTSQINGDELAVEVVFERGLVHLENMPAGKKKDVSVTVRIEHAPSGSNAWVTVIEQAIVGRQTTPLYWGHSWRPGDYSAANAGKNWDVRVTRITSDFDEERNFGNFTWIALRTLTWGNPVPVPYVAMLAMRIRSSEQLQGVIDTFNVVAWTMARDWDIGTGTWVWRPTASPAALFRHVLQHPARERPAADAQIDLARLQYWDGVTRPTWRMFNGVIEARGALWEVLVKIGRIGRAMPSLRDLKFSVIIDEPRTTPVRLFTPRNSWGYEGEMSHAPTPHAYRISYVDQAQDWRTDEVLVYDDGYDASNAVRIDKVDWQGIIDRGQATHEGRFHLAQQRLRREIHHLYSDFEQLACERGDLVALQHDVIAVGLGSARVSARTEVGTVITGLTLDAAMTMQTGKSYAVRVRRVVSGAMRTDLLPVVTVAGEQKTLGLKTPPAIIDAPEVGDLVAFGELGRETLRVLIRDIEPQQDLSAKLTLIAEAPGVHTAEAGPIPPYDPVVTQPRQLPAPVIISIESDARVMLVTASRSLIDRVIFALQPIAIEGAHLYVLYRPTGTNAAWQTATIQEETESGVAIIGPQSGEAYDFRLQYTHSTLMNSPVTARNGYYVIGRVGPPEDLQNLSLAVVGGQALLRWDLAPDLDVQIGGYIMFRHTPDMDATIWPNTTSLARAVAGDQTHVYLPLKPGTYFGRVYDADGRASVNATAISTKQASILAFAPLGDVQEDPNFTGPKTRCHIASGGLMLDAEDFDSIPDLDAETLWDVSGGVSSTGLYQFAAGIDLGAVKRSRITSHMKLEAVNEHDYWDAKIGNIDSWPDIDGTIGAAVDATIYGKLTDGNPAATPTWSVFTRIDSAEITARAVGQMECRLSTSDRAFNLWLSELRVAAEEVA